MINKMFLLYALSLHQAAQDKTMKECLAIVDDLHAWLMKLARGHLKEKGYRPDLIDAVAVVLKDRDERERKLREGVT